MVQQLFAALMQLREVSDEELQSMMEAIRQRNLAISARLEALKTERELLLAEQERRQQAQERDGHEAPGCAAATGNDMS